jgi:hypothetical protein
MTAAPALTFQTPGPGTALIVVGAVLLYFASRAAAEALAAGDPRRAGVRALGHCMPIAAVALMCLLPAVSRPDPAGGRPQVAVGVVFASSVACLSLVLGIVTYLAPVVALPPSRRAWPFVMPAALLALVAGFTGTLTLTHAGVLALLGVVVMNLWVATDEPPPAGSVAVLPAEADDRAGGGRLRWLQFALAVLLTLVGGWAMARGAAKLELGSRTFTGPLVAAAVLSPLLTLPVLSTTTRLAERGEAGSAAATLVAIALVNLCLVLPLVVVAHHLLTGPLAPAAATAATTSPSVFDVPGAGAFGRPAPFPLLSWRIDAVLLVVLGFGLIPWSLGRWAAARAESAALIFGYALYLAITAFLAYEWR